MSKVTIYTRQMCGYSTRAVRLLERKSIPFDEIDATFDPTKRQEMIARAKGASTFPQVFVGDVHVGGSDELYALDQSGKLDPLLQQQGVIPA